MMEKTIREFESPSEAFRGKPFWAWNGRLEEGELRRQIRIMKRMGLGGFFMHSRVGLETPYLSPEWFSLVEACIDEARRIGMEAWLYDEDRWPSGAAGGLVTREARFRQKRLRCIVVKARRFRWNRSVIRAFSAEVEGDRARNVKPLGRGSRPSTNAPHVVYFTVATAPCDPWYNGYTYLDTMSEEAVRAFIRSTHSAYARRVGGEFGRLVPGIFTDEPNYGGHDRMEKPPDGAIAAWEFPWTDNLPATFRRRYGYELLDHLPELFFDVEGVRLSRARYHYHDCITAMFVGAFARTIGRWCEKHGIALTGHVLMEETLSSQTYAIGSAMRFYEYMQIPGIDNLTENNYEFDTAKQCASVCRQMGRPRMLSELYGCTGWDFPFEGHKADGDWQAVLGVNLRCQHLAWYTMLGEAKRDYPASISYQSPWWEYYSKVEDYFARVSLAMSRGRAVRHLLVVHPIESMWTRFSGDWRKSRRVEELDRRFATLRDWLLQEHLDFDYGDEEMMGRLGSVKKERGGRALLRVGKADYRAVLVPPLDTIRSSTLDLLEKFADAGGLVVFAGRPPKFVDALADDSAEGLARRCKRVAFARRPVCEALESACRTVSLADEKGREVRSLLYQLREETGAHYLFIINLDRRKACENVLVRVGVEGEAEEWDAETGRRFSARQRREGNHLVIETDFPPTGSRLFVIRKRGGGNLPHRPRYETVKRRPLPRTPDVTSLDEPNVLVLDRPRFRIEGGKWRGPEEILRVDREVRRSLGVAPRGGNMVQPWARPKPSRKKSRRLDLLFEFEVREIPAGPVELAVEQPHRFAIAVNGTQIATDKETGWWVDRSIRRLPIDPAHLKLGRNEIALSIAYTEDDGLEASFLLGWFGVAVEATEASIVAPPRKLRPGDWCKLGLPFYSGAVTYEWRAEIEPPSNGERVFLAVPRFRGACARVLVNGRQAGIIAWQPHELDITDLVGEGENMIGVEVISSRRNSFGPLHQAEPEDHWTGPLQFITTGDRWTDAYNLKPHGLLAPPVIEYRTVRPEP